MPHRNIIRHYTEDASYHCYNRGVEKRKIFLDEQDYGVFLQRLKLMLANPEGLDKEDVAGRVRVKSFYGEVQLISYCLMPNHFHLLLRQESADAIPEFMRTLSTSYTMYFNKRYDRVGSLFQGRYKARLVDSDPYRLHISRYIHLNPLDLVSRLNLDAYLYSSMRFLREPDLAPSWLGAQELLDDFGGSYQKYKKFVYEYAAPDMLEALDEEYSL